MSCVEITKKNCLIELFQSLQCFKDDRFADGMVHFDLFIQHAPCIDVELKDAEGKIYRRVWKAMGQPIAGSNPELAHPDFGRVAFRNIEGRSVANAVRAKAIESYFLHFIRNELKKIALAFRSDYRGSDSLFNALFEYSSEIPPLLETEGLVYRMIWERMGKPTEETHPGIAHPDLGRLSFHSLEDRSCSNQEKADALDSVVREMDFRKWTDRLHQRASNYFQRHTGFLPIDTRHISSLESTNQTRLLTTLFSQYQGVCFGETHGLRYSHEVFHKHMDLFQRCGVRTFFMELFPMELQQDLDVFNRGGELTEKLKDRCRLNDDAKFFHSHETFKLIDTARRGGIRIVGIDSNTAMNSWLHNFSLWLDGDRLEDMNYVAAKIIDREKGTGLFIAWMGRAHLTNVKITESLTFPSRSEMQEIALRINPTHHWEDIIGNSLLLLTRELFNFEGLTLLYFLCQNKNVDDRVTEIIRKRIKVVPSEAIIYGVSELVHCPSIDLANLPYKKMFFDSCQNEQKTAYNISLTEANFRFKI